MSHENGQRFLARLFGVKQDLPFAPDILRALFVQTGDVNVPLATVAATVERDQGLTLRLLALANSAFYGLQSEVTTISRALMVLGLKEVRTMALALGVQAMTRRQPLPGEFDLRDYWGHQLAVAATARGLGNLAGMEADNLFTACLLHDLGKLLAAMHAPEDWRAITAIAEAEGLSYIRSEDRHWGLDHGVVGALLLKSWNLPASLFEPVNWHHAPEVAPEFGREAQLLCLADALVRGHDDDAARRSAALGLKPEEAREAAGKALEDEAAGAFLGVILSDGPGSGRPR